VLALGGANNHAFANAHISQRKIGHYYCRIWLQEKEIGSIEWKPVALKRLHVDNNLTVSETIKHVDDTLELLYSDGKKVFMPDSVRIELYSTDGCCNVRYKNGKRVLTPGLVKPSPAKAVSI